MSDHVPGTLATIMSTSGLYGPVREDASGSLHSNNIVAATRDAEPVIVISNVRVRTSWGGEKLHMVYIVSPSHLGWTWQENVQ